jgi:hypothetical protein
MEKLAVRGQLFENLRANSRAIGRKLSKIWTDQTILQSVHEKPDSLLGNRNKKAPANRGWERNKTA